MCVCDFFCDFPTEKSRQIHIMRSSHFGLVQETRCYKSKLNIYAQDFTQIPDFRVPTVTSQAAELSTWISAAPPSAMAEVAAIPLCVFAKPPVLTPQVTIGPMAKWQDHWSLWPGRVATPDFSGRFCHFTTWFPSHCWFPWGKDAAGSQHWQWSSLQAWECWLIWCHLWLNMAEDPLGQSPKCPSPAKCCSRRQVGDGQQLRSLKRHWMARGWAGLGNHATHCRFQEEASILKLAFTLFDNCHEQLWFLRPLLATSSQWQLESTGPTQC